MFFYSFITRDKQENLAVSPLQKVCFYYDYIEALETQKNTQ